MHKIVAILFIVLAGILKPPVIVAAVWPNCQLNSSAVISLTDSTLLKYARISSKEFEKATGHRVKFKERLAFKLLQLRWSKAGTKKLSHADANEKIEKKALWAKWLGIGSLIGLIIPGVGLLSLPAAIVAIVLGAETIKQTQHPKYSRQGITFGIITLSLILIIGFIVALVTLLPVA
jgi:hypothetical protein